MGRAGADAPTGGYGAAGMTDRNAQLEERLARIEAELGILKLAISSLAQQDIEVLTAAKTNDEAEMKKAFEDIRSNIKEVGAVTKSDRGIGTLPEIRRTDDG